ncbi:hypothetical protein [Streptomyces sp. 8N706]|uniref:hypothetical protein n=1 Tax=Streptomyces sp. 8N706 TaxID=3457416 RepID=UPI003FCF6B5F
MAKGGQMRRAEDLAEHDLARARIREEHLLEMETDTGAAAGSGPDRTSRVPRSIPRRPR